MVVNFGAAWDKPSSRSAVAPSHAAGVSVREWASGMSGGGLVLGDVMAAQRKQAVGSPRFSVVVGLDLKQATSDSDSTVPCLAFILHHRRLASLTASAPLTCSLLWPLSTHCE